MIARAMHSTPTCLEAAARRRSAGPTRPIGRGPRRSRSSQRGVVLFIALIVMVALTLAGVALVRAVDTSTIVVGNLSFSQASILPANMAVEEAVSVMFEKELITNLNVDASPENYFATRQDNEDARGVPDLLSTKAKASTLAKNLDDGNGNNIHYVIERMCAKGIPVNPSRNDMVQYCDMLPPKPSGTTSMETDKIELPRIPMYRLTVRVDGPQNTVSFMQAMLR